MLPPQLTGPWVDESCTSRVSGPPLLVHHLILRIRKRRVVRDRLSLPLRFPSEFPCNEFAGTRICLSLGADVLFSDREQE